MKPRTLLEELHQVSCSQPTAFSLSSELTFQATPYCCAAVLRLQHDFLLALKQVDRPIKGYVGPCKLRGFEVNPNSFDPRVNRGIPAEDSFLTISIHL